MEHLSDDSNLCRIRVTKFESIFEGYNAFYNYLKV